MSVLPFILLLVVWTVASYVSSHVSASTDEKLKWAKDRWYNPSLVEHQGSFISAAKHTEFKRFKGKTWWLNSLNMCHGTKQDMQHMNCTQYDPWEGRAYRECEFDGRVRGGKLDTSGLGDVKVWKWPGKGVYAIFGRKPQRNGTDPRCNDFIVYHQWISLIQKDEAAVELDPWILKSPMALLPASIKLYPSWQKFAMEKNWMPFVYKDVEGTEHLYVTYTVQPHMVFEVLPGGSSVHRWTTHDVNMMAKFATFDVHGGPPLVFVAEQQSPSQVPFFLGIMHHIERYDNGRVRLYRHFAFKVAAHPPFQITAVSDELPLVFNSTHKEKTAFIAFVCGLDVNPEGQVYISYGAADIEARLLLLSLPELEQLFTGAIAFRDTKVPHKPVLTSPKSLQSIPHVS